MKFESLVSVIIPAYKVENYIEECLDSVITQSYTNLEVLCVEDCGLDKSAEIIECYCSKDSRIQLVKNQSNLGVAKSRNKGIRMAKGEYIYCLDPDDYLSSKTIEVMLQSAKEESSDVVVSRTELTVDEGVAEERIKSTEEYINGFEFPTKATIVSRRRFAHYVDKVPCVVWNKLFRADFLRENEILFVNQNVIHEDEGFHVKVLANEPRISFLDYVGYYHRLRASSYMQFALENRQNLIRNLKTSLDDAIAYLERHNKHKYVRLVKSRYWYSQCYLKEKDFKYYSRFVRKYVFKVLPTSKFDQKVEKLELQLKAYKK